jgi:hypothetical protein
MCQILVPPATLKKKKLLMVLKAQKDPNTVFWENLKYLCHQQQVIQTKKISKEASELVDTLGQMGIDNYRVFHPITMQYARCYSLTLVQNRPYFRIQGKS